MMIPGLGIALHPCNPMQGALDEQGPDGSQDLVHGKCSHGGSSRDIVVTNLLVLF